jgi:hypothetical protein
MHKAPRHPTLAEIADHKRSFPWCGEEDEQAVLSFLSKVSTQQQRGLIARFRDRKRNKEASEIAGVTLAAFRKIRDRAIARFAVKHRGKKFLIESDILSAMQYSLEVYAIARPDEDCEPRPRQSTDTFSTADLRAAFLPYRKRQ